MLTDDQITTWQAELERVQAEPEWAAGDSHWNAHRTPEVVGALRDLLHAFLAGEISLSEFQTTFDKNTRTIWDVFGLKGMSGAMFLNTLVKYMPDKQAVERALKHALPVPDSEHAAKEHMSRLVDLVDSATTSGAVKKTQVQASRTAFFGSAWWYIQNRDAWPVYYVSMRRVFERHGVWKAQQTDIVEDYFTFRENALTLADALDVDIWKLERLCLWLGGATKEAESDPVPVTILKPVAPEPESDGTDGGYPEQVAAGTPHSQIQLLLARLGKKFNCKVWIAQNDHGKQWEGEKLGTYSIPSLPTLGIADPAQNIVRMIDVIWLKGANQVIAGFEVEHNTSIYSGLLRMIDLAVLAPNTHFPIYIVAPETKLERVREQLRRPTFQHIELHQRARFFSMVQLIADAPHMLKWATDAAVIDELAQRVDDVDLDSSTYLPTDLDEKWDA